MNISPAREKNYTKTRRRRSGRGKGGREKQRSAFSSFLFTEAPTDHHPVHSVWQPDISLTETISQAPGEALTLRGDWAKPP